MTQVAQVKYGTGVRYLRPIGGKMMYTYIDFEYHSHLSTTFNLTFYLYTCWEMSSTEGYYPYKLQ